VPARDPRHAASNLLLGLAGAAVPFAATVATTTGAQGPFAVAGLAGLAVGAGYAARLLAVEVAEDERADTEIALASAYTELEFARMDLDAERDTQGWVRRGSHRPADAFADAGLRDATPKGGWRELE
jgi:hypothetical protein